MRNESLIDAWTAAHVATGVVAATVGVSFWNFMLLSVAYEGAEMWLEHPSGSKLFGTKRPESLANVTGDLVANAAGYWLGKSLTS